MKETYPFSRTFSQSSQTNHFIFSKPPHTRSPCLFSSSSHFHWFLFFLPCPCISPFPLPKSLLPFLFCLSLPMLPSIIPPSPPPPSPPLSPPPIPLPSFFSQSNYQKAHNLLSSLPSLPPLSPLLPPLSLLSPSPLSISSLLPLQKFGRGEKG